MEVKLGKPTLEDVGESGMSMAWEMRPELAPPGMEASGEIHEEWVDIEVAIELQPWPDRNWLLFWQEGDLGWPDGFDEPVLDGRRLIFEAPEDELQAGLGRRQSASRAGERDVPRGVPAGRARS